MKRIALFFDGTWRDPDRKYPSNVVRLCQMAERTAPGKTVQQIFYHPGVGTGRGTGRAAKLVDRATGGLSGAGINDIIAQAYRQVVLNYEEDDEIFIFGWSRGAFAARRLVVLLRHCGLVSHRKLKHLQSAIDHGLALNWNEKTYPDLDGNLAKRAELSPEFVTSKEENRWRRKQGIPEGKLINVQYLGLWDCVSALGWPQFSGALQRIFRRRNSDEHYFGLTRLVRSARHAVAIDEQRVFFPPSLWDNLAALNQITAPIRGKGERHLAYQQLWFPGDHGAVGGGNLWGQALATVPLAFIAEGAELQGMRFGGPEYFSTMNHANPLARFEGPAPISPVEALFRRPRDDIRGFEELSEAARYRWALYPEYRPAALSQFADALDRYRAA